MSAGELVAAVLGGGAALAAAQAVGKLLWNVYQGWRVAQAAERPSRVALAPAEPTVEQRLAAIEEARRKDAERLTDAAIERAAVKAVTRIMERADEVRRRPTKPKPKEPDNADRRSEDPPTDP